MYIHEAIAASNESARNGSGIRRKGWFDRGAYIVPSDGPDRCFVCGSLGVYPWTPSASDLLADDWECHLNLTRRSARSRKE